MGVFRNALLALLLTLPWAVAFFPLDADGAFSIHDSIIYGVIAETEPGWSLNPHHPGFHVLQAGLMPPLEACGVEHPGFVAARILAGIGAALALALIASFAKGRWLFGASCALAFACSRIALMEIAVGEVNLPAIAAALWALREACATRLSLWRFGASLVVALCLRADSILLLPGLVTAAAFSGQTNLKALLRLLCWCGAATLGFYALCFQFVSYEFDGRQIRFMEWLVLYAHVPQMAVTHTAGFDRAAVYARSLGTATLGQYSGAIGPHALAGAAWCALLLGAGWLARGAAPLRRMAWAVALMLAVRIPFFIWFEPENCEWHALNLALLAALAAWCAGAPASRRLGDGAVFDGAHGAPASRRLGGVMAGTALLLLLCGASLAVHGGGLVQLRQRSLISGVQQVVDAAGPNTTFITLNDDRAAHALRYLHIYPSIVTTADAVVGAATDLVRAGKTVAIVTDRVVGDALPYTSDDNRRGARLLDALRAAELPCKTRYFDGPQGPFAVILHSQ